MLYNDEFKQQLLSAYVARARIIRALASVLDSQRATRGDPTLGRIPISNRRRKPRPTGAISIRAIVHSNKDHR